ncbi:MAG TPA: protease inhibitor I9 family protein [Blastocatellia bacterium]|jgi:hypothetical protein|nr:protease inhibitor I9 family protein [Blastocatellia bacterium]
MKYLKMSEEGQPGFFNRAKRSFGSAALMCLAVLAAAAPALAQNSKMSEQELRNEIENQGRPLTVRRAPAQSRIPDRYIVMFRPEVAVRTEARNIAKEMGGKIHFVYSEALHGFAATLSPEAVERLRYDRRIALIEEDRMAQAAQLPVTQSPQSPAPSWALDRIDQRGPQLDNSFTFPASGGAGVHIYILDSGILGGIFGQAGAHVELAGRIGDGFDSITLTSR